MLVEPLLVLPKEPPEMRNKKWFAAACCVLFLSAPAAAQNWPTKPVRLIVGFPPGGSTDPVARYLAEPLSYSLGQQVVVDNRAGANGAMGTAIAARSTPDGYNYLVVYDSHATNPSLQKHIPFDTVKDFAPIMLIASSPMVVVVNPASPYRPLGDLIAAARSRPGELPLGSGGGGSRGERTGEAGSPERSRAGSAGMGGSAVGGYPPASRRPQADSPTHAFRT